MWLPSLDRRQNDNPCPQANGTTIGTFQPFVLLCDSNVVGDKINETDADSFLQCVDTCASFHPRCDAVSFNRRTCELKANLQEDKTRPAKRFDAAIAQPASASSNCGNLGASSTSGTMKFDVFCNHIVNGNDMSQDFAATFQDCMGLCTATTGCGGVSFDAGMTQGFKNCYLKSAVSPGEPIVDQGIDSAVVNNAAVADPAPAPAPPASSSETPILSTTSSTLAAVPQSSSSSPSSPVSSALNVSTAVPQPATSFATELPQSTLASTTTASEIASADSVTVATSAAPETTSGGSFVTLTPTTSTPIAAVPETVSTTIVSYVTMIGNTPTTQVMTVPVPQSSGSLAMGTPAVATSAAGAAVDDGASATSGTAWIAAPVIGSVAAVMVIAVAFVMWGRKRSANRSSSFFSRLPFTRAGQPRSPGSPGSPRWPAVRNLPFGNYWSMRSGGSQRLRDDESSMRGNSRSGVVTREKERENTPQYEVSRGKLALRDSTVNPLAQHRSTLDGIPNFLRE